MPLQALEPQEKSMRRMSRIGRTVLLGAWMLWAGSAFAENPPPPEDQPCKGECKKELNPCIETCKQNCWKVMKNCGMAGGMCMGGCAAQCERSAKSQK